MLLFEELQRQISDLRKEHEDRIKATRRANAAQDVERARLGRDLHDGPLGEVILIQQALDLCEYLVEDGDTQAAQAQLKRASTLLREQAAAMRSITNQLRPVELSAHGLAGALGLLPIKLADRLQIVVENHVTAALLTEVETAVYYVVREALTNAITHAGAQRAWVQLEQRGGTLQVQVRDDGTGFDVLETQQRAEEDGRHGLSAMRERITLLGGQFDIQSSHNTRGTTVRFTIPVLAPEP